MFLVELALQGVRGFPATARLPLKPGVNVAVRAQGPERAALIDLVFSALYPDAGRNTSRWADPKASAARLAVTLYGRDRVTYRLLRDLGTGATRLFRFDISTQRYQLLSETAPEIAQFLRTQQQLPDEATFERLFLFSADTLASKQSARIAPVAPGMRPLSAMEPPRAPSTLNITNALVQSEMDRGAPPSETVEEQLESLRRLRQERQMAEEIERAQAELDRWNSKKVALQQKTARISGLRARFSELDQARQANRGLEGLSASYLEQLRHQEDTQARYENERARTLDEQANVQRELDQKPLTPLWTDRYFLLALLASFFFVALAIGLMKPSVALLHPFALVVALGAALNWVSEAEDRARRLVRLRAVEERLARLEKQRDLEVGATRRLLTELDIASIPALIERIEAHRALVDEWTAAKKALDEATADPEALGAEQALAQLQRELERLDAIVVGGAGLSGSAETLRRRIAQLEQSLRGRGVVVPGDRQAPPRSISTIDLPPPSGEPMRSPTLVGLPAWPPPGAPLEATGDVFSTAGGYAPIDPVERGRAPSVITPASKSVAKPAPKNVPGAGLFDFGGGVIGEDDDEDDAYGSKGGGGGQSLAAEDQIEYLLMGGGSGGWGGASGYDEPAAPDRSRDLFEAAAELTQLDPERLGAQVSARLGQYLLAFTDGRYDKVELGPRGEVTVLPRKSGDPVAYVALEGEILDLVDAAIRFTLVEHVVRKVRVPVLMNDPFGNFPPKRRTLLAQMLGYLGAATQVLVVTERSDLSGHQLV